MKVLVTGASGFIGSALVRDLEDDGHHVTRVVRSATSGTPGSNDAWWDIGAGTIHAAALEGHDAAVHLAGAGIGDRRWSEGRKREVRESRVKGTSLLCGTLAALERPPAVLVSGSAVGYYGPDRGDEELTESSQPGSGFLADVVTQWEAATASADRADGLRVAHIRTGLVLDPSGGLFGRLLLPFKLGLGGRLGSGRQWWPWVTLTDVVAAIRHVIDTASLSGPVNLTAPNPVTNADFTKTLGRTLRRPTPLPTPLLPLKLAFGKEMVDETILAGQRARPEALQRSGFTWRHETLDHALGDMFGR